MEFMFNPNVDLYSGNFSKGVLFFGVYGYADTQYTITLFTQGKLKALYSSHIRPVPGVSDVTFCPQAKNSFENYRSYNSP